VIATGHIMVDLETMGQNPGCSVISLAAVHFNIETGETGKEFYHTISLQSNFSAGLLPEPDTILWWMQQSNEARAVFDNTSQQLHIAQALILFQSFVNDSHSLWGNGARFDLGILTEAYRKVYLKPSWDPKKELDVRTLVDFYPEIKATMPFTGTRHNALDDCRHQIKYCSETYRKLKNLA